MPAGAATRWARFFWAVRPRRSILLAANAILPVMVVVCGGQAGVRIKRRAEEKSFEMMMLLAPAVRAAAASQTPAIRRGPPNACQSLREHSKPCTGRPIACAIGRLAKAKGPHGTDAPRPVRFWLPPCPRTCCRRGLSCPTSGPASCRPLRAALTRFEGRHPGHQHGASDRCGQFTAGRGREHQPVRARRALCGEEGGEGKDERRASLQPRTTSRSSPPRRGQTTQPRERCHSIERVDQIPHGKTHRSATPHDEAINGSGQGQGE